MAFTDIPSVNLTDYDYNLPEDRIAPYPLAERDGSRLLVVNVDSDEITHHTFADLPSMLPSTAMLLMNDTRVVRARILMQRPTGGRIEVMLLDPLEPSTDPSITLAAHSSTTWCCMIGGARKLVRQRSVSVSFAYDADTGTITATLQEITGDGYVVRFDWEPASLSFAEVLESVGRIPLPPYIKRESTEYDATTYQTVYAEQEGAVAAPTAGLHFTTATLEALRNQGIRLESVTLHVGAGTFKQVKDHNIATHDMHRERILVSAETLAALIEHARKRQTDAGHPFVIVGTTTLRTVESLYWFGVRVLAQQVDGDEINVEQWDPYNFSGDIETLPNLVDALLAVDRWRIEHGLDVVTGSTRILIVPGYQFRCCDALITNFHQPGSTLILLVAAFLGHDLWQRAYNTALAGGYRFLSYGDSSLLTRGMRMQD